MFRDFQTASDGFWISNTACVRTAHTLRVGFEVPRNSQLGCVAQPRTQSVGYTGYGLFHVLILKFRVIHS